MNLIEISPGVLRLDTDIFDNEEDVQYNPSSFMYYDNIEFTTIHHFTAHVKDLLLKYNRQAYSDIDTSVDLDGGTDMLSIVSFTSPLTKFTLNIPQRSNIIEIEREFIYLSIFKSVHSVIFQQPLQTFKQLAFYATAYF